MTLSIPDSVFTFYREGADWLIDNDNVGRQHTLIYPPRRVTCTRCSLTTQGGTSTNVYQHGGPAPFSRVACPLCGGNGYHDEEVTGTIRLRVYWNRRDWITIAGGVNVPDAEAMVIGYSSNLDDLRKATDIRLYNYQNHAEYNMRLAAEPSLHGFGRNRYFMAFLKRA